MRIWITEYVFYFSLECKFVRFQINCSPVWYWNFSFNCDPFLRTDDGDFEATFRSNSKIWISLKKCYGIFYRFNFEDYDSILIFALKFNRLKKMSIYLSFDDRVAINSIAMIQISKKRMCKMIMAHKGSNYKLLSI